MGGPTGLPIVLFGCLLAPGAPGGHQGDPDRLRLEIVQQAAHPLKYSR